MALATAAHDNYFGNVIGCGRVTGDVVVTLRFFGGPPFGA